MANLTLSLDDKLLQQAREAALRERTSVNALVREYLQNYVNARARRISALDALAEHSQSSSAERWTRESLHQRSAE